jgi:hypothetical protein
LGFQGSGVSVLSAAPLVTNDLPPVLAPKTVSETFTGVLNPGTYDFLWNAAEGTTYMSNVQSDTESGSMSATFSVTAIPEPASFLLITLAAGCVSFRRPKSL